MNPGSDSGVHEVPLLIDQHDKLDVLKSKLIEAEEARRSGNCNFYQMNKFGSHVICGFVEYS